MRARLVGPNNVNSVLVIHIDVCQQLTDRVRAEVPFS